MVEHELMEFVLEYAKATVSRMLFSSVTRPVKMSRSSSSEQGRSVSARLHSVSCLIIYLPWRKLYVSVYFRLVNTMSPKNYTSYSY